MPLYRPDQLGAKGGGSGDGPGSNLISQAEKRYQEFLKESRKGKKFSHCEKRCQKFLKEFESRKGKKF
jgi:hypothetical protein